MYSDESVLQGSDTSLQQDLVLYVSALPQER
jgi:hypothetical protein